MTPLRAFLSSFRESLSRASVSVGGVSICFDAPRDRPPARIREGWIDVPRLTDARDVLRCWNERGEGIYVLERPTQDPGL